MMALLGRFPPRGPADEGRPGRKVALPHATAILRGRCLGVKDGVLRRDRETRPLQRRGPAPDFQRWSGKDTPYVVRRSRPAMVRREATERIEHELATDPTWQEVETEAEARDLRAVSIRKYVYKPAVTPG